jgi:hypothetical protein
MIATVPIRESNRLPNNPESDADSLNLAVRDLLRSSGYRLLRTLRCQVREGVVTIWGTVPSFFLKQMAQEAVLKLDQIREVKNLVEVRAGETLPAPDLEADSWQMV